jgi:putative hydrolase of the HAD superfamily
MTFIRPKYVQIEVKVADLGHYLCKMAIKNLILDLGGVIVDLDTDKTLEEFRKLGLVDIDKLYSFHSQESLIDDYEVGRITTSAFREGVRTRFERNIEDQEIDIAWNAMLQGIKPEVFDQLDRLAQDFRLFCLSNTNDLHLSALFTYLGRKHPEQKLIDSFEKEYFSHIMQMRKPNREAFDHILAENGLEPSETFFVDDKTEHLAGAASAGIYTFHFQDNNSLLDMLLLNEGNISPTSIV